MTTQNAAALQHAISSININYGSCAIRRAGELPRQEAIATGLPELDAALGVGGIPKGKIVEIYGPEAAGKTEFALHIASMAQSALYIDADHGLVSARLSGYDGLHLLSVDTLEEALQVIKIAAESFDIIVVDTLTALPTRQELIMSMGESARGAAAKILAAALPRLTTQLAKTGCALVIVNQTRTAPVLYGDPVCVPGGCALKHYAAMRAEIRRIEILKEDGRAVGQRIKIKLSKNKCAVPMREVRLDLRFGAGLYPVRR